MGKEKHCSSYTNPGSEEQEQVPEQPPHQPPLLGLHLLQHLLAAGTEGTNLAGSNG